MTVLRVALERILVKIVKGLVVTYEKDELEIVVNSSWDTFDEWIIEHCVGFWNYVYLMLISQELVCYLLFVHNLRSYGGFLTTH